MPWINIDSDIKPDPTKRYQVLMAGKVIEVTCVNRRFAYTSLFGVYMGIVGLPFPYQLQEWSDEPPITCHGVGNGIVNFECGKRILKVTHNFTSRFQNGRLIGEIDTRTSDFREYFAWLMEGE